MKKLNFMASIASISIAALLSSSAIAENYTIMLFDETGSMSALRPADGLSRCEYGKQVFMQSVEIGINRSDYLDVQTFGEPGSRSSLLGDFIDVRGLNPYVGVGKAYYDDIESKINALQCRAPSTALGDAVCEAMDQLKSMSGATGRNLGLLTDAGENSSRICSNGTSSDRTAYIDNHIVPRSIAPPPVRLNIAILQRPGGNVSRFATSFSSLEEFETEAPLSYQTEKGNAQTKAILPYTEAQALTNAARRSGGGAIVIDDDQICAFGCDPLSQDPDWGGIF